MTHKPNRTNLPPKKSADEYEREIAILKLLLQKAETIIKNAHEGHLMDLLLTFLAKLILICMWRRLRRRMTKFSEIGYDVGSLVSDKQRAYGDSFGRSGECLRQMFPDGIKTEQYDDLLTIARILDKLFRIANNPNAFDENPYQDIVGYGLLGMNRHKVKK